MDYRANYQLSDAAGRVIAEPGETVPREAIPSDDANLALLVDQGIVTPVEAEGEGADELP